MKDNLTGLFVDSEQQLALLTVGEGDNRSGGSPRPTALLRRMTSMPVVRAAGKETGDKGVLEVICPRY